MVILLLSPHFSCLRASGAFSFIDVLFLMLFCLRYLGLTPSDRASLRAEGVVILAAKSIPKDVLCVFSYILMILETRPPFLLIRPPAPLGWF